MSASLGTGGYVLVISLVLAACGGEDSRPTGATGLEGAESETCAGLASMALAADDFDDLGTSSTIDELHERRDAMQAAFQEVRLAAGEQANMRIDTLERAVENLNRAVDSVSGAATVGAAFANLQVEARSVEQAVEDFEEQLACP